jgi:peptidoglycan/xylan/chitin deacetylase (PgdA/CDA1 family)
VAAKSFFKIIQHITTLIKSFLSKFNFLLGNKPKILRYSNENLNKFIPHPYKAIFIISCDFELAWAWRFANEVNCDLQKAQESALRERENTTFILQLCEKFDIPITWAIVGHLFLDRCERKNGTAHADIIRLKHFENKYWKFSSGDWFDNDPCCNWKDAKEWYAPDLIKLIFSSRVKHEIACHTFSHIDCSEKICPQEVLRSETRKCKEIASSYGIGLESFVFPGNISGNLGVLKEEGFSSYRLDRDILGFPEKDKYGLWQVPTTAAIGLSSYNWNPDYYLKRYRIIIERAIKYQRLCHFWFHPSENKEFLEFVLTHLFQFIDSARDELYITTMGAYAKYLENAKI